MKTKIQNQHPLFEQSYVPPHHDEGVKISPIAFSSKIVHATEEYVAHSAPLTDLDRTRRDVECDDFLAPLLERERCAPTPGTDVQDTTMSSLKHPPVPVIPAGDVSEVVGTIHLQETIVAFDHECAARALKPGQQHRPERVPRFRFRNEVGHAAECYYALAY